MIIKFIDNEKSTIPGKLADAELYLDGPLDGLKLIGFAVWERRGDRATRNVTFPARQYSVNGERRSFALLRPIEGPAGSTVGLRDLILEAYAEHELETKSVTRG